MGVSKADSDEVGPLLLKFHLMFAQLRDVLAAEDSTVVAKEDDHGRPLGPQRSKLDRVAVGIRQRDGSKTGADGIGHGAAIFRWTKTCVNALRLELRYKEDS